MRLLTTLALVAAVQLPSVTSAAETIIQASGPHGPLKGMMLAPA